MVIRLRVSSFNRTVDEISGHSQILESSFMLGCSWHIQYLVAYSILVASSLPTLNYSFYNKQWVISSTVKGFLVQKIVCPGGNILIFFTMSAQPWKVSVASVPFSEGKPPTLPAPHPREDTLSNKEQRTTEDLAQIESSSASENESVSLKKLKLKQKKVEKAQKRQKRQQDAILKNKDEILNLLRNNKQMKRKATNKKPKSKRPLIQTDSSSSSSTSSSTSSSESSTH